MIGSYKYFVAYYANVKKDNAKAVEYCDKIIALDPTDNEAVNNRKALLAPAAAPRPKAATTKPVAKPAPASKK